MKPASFEYFAPTTLPAAVALLAHHADDAKLLAGGQSLVPLMNMRLARPRYLIDLNRIDEMAYIRDDNGMLRIGAMTRQETIEHSPLLRARCPLLCEATTLIAHPAIRNRGTIGGSLAHADPAAELPAVIRALDGRITVTGPRSERTLTAESFLVGALTTGLAANEIVTEIVVPALPPRAGTCFLEVARRHGDFALAGVAVIVAAGSDGTCAHARLAFCGVGPTPVRVERAESLLAGRRLDDGLLREVELLVKESLEPESDLHASADYRREVAGVLARRALTVAWERASGG